MCLSGFYEIFIYVRALSHVTIISMINCKFFATLVKRAFLLICFVLIFNRFLCNSAFTLILLWTEISHSNFSFFKCASSRTIWALSCFFFFCKVVIMMHFIQIVCQLMSLFFVL